MHDKSKNHTLNTGREPELQATDPNAVTSNTYMSFEDAISLYRCGCRIRSVATGRTYIDYRNEQDDTKFKLCEIEDSWYIEPEGGDTHAPTTDSDRY